jgi:hypothetical protein
MELDWITPQQASDQWGITVRQVQSLCSQERVRGAIRLGRVWLIPKNTPRPQDGRTKVAKSVKLPKQEDNNK